jgi:hypothetical protein
MSIADFETKLRKLINIESVDSYAGIPDFLLTEHIMHYLAILKSLTESNCKWHGDKCKPNFGKEQSEV